MDASSAMAGVSWLAVVAAALLTFVLGGLWYSPALFGKAWQREARLTDEQLKNANMAMIFGLTFVLCVLAAWMFAIFLGPRPKLAEGLMYGFSAGALTHIRLMPCCGASSCVLRSGSARGLSLP